MKLLAIFIKMRTSYNLMKLWCYLFSTRLTWWVWFLQCYPTETTVCR